MSVRRTVLFGALLFVVFAASTKGNQQAGDQNQLPSNYLPSGEQLYMQYCAACHGANAKGYGPARTTLKIPAADLTTLAKRHGGMFPYPYVTEVLRFGPGVPSHGSADMPVWGPIFANLDSHNNKSVQQRIKNLCDYLASLQGKSLQGQ